MTAELIQYAIYAALALLGYFIRHKRIPIPGLPGHVDPPAPIDPTKLPDLQNPLVQGLLVLVKQILETQAEQQKAPPPKP